MDFNQIDTITAILYISFFIPVIRGIIVAHGAQYLEHDICSFEKSIVLIAELFVSLIITKNIVILRNFGVFYKYVPSWFVSFLDDKPKLSYIIVLIIVIYLMYYVGIMLLKILNYFTLKPLISLLNRAYHKCGRFSRRLLSGLFAVPRGLYYLVMVSFLLNWSSAFEISENLNTHLNESSLYITIVNKVINPITNSSFAKNIPKVISDSLKIVKVEKEEASVNNSGYTVYYNGVTLDSGVKSNDAINNEAVYLTQNCRNDKDKAKALYSWIGRNIEYDYDKAKLIMRGDYSIPSGAIYTYENRKGICFDYAALYVAMARAVGLRVRLITGQGFNGTTWVSHAWNEVYVNGKWINVDATFYTGGNYFDSKNFNLDHRSKEIAGEWK